MGMTTKMVCKLSRNPACMFPSFAHFAYFAYIISRYCIAFDSRVCHKSNHVYLSHSNHPSSFLPHIYNLQAQSYHHHAVYGICNRLRRGTNANVLNHSTIEYAYRKPQHDSQRSKGGPPTTAFTHPKKVQGCT